MNIGIDIDDTINNLCDILLEYGTKYNKDNNIEYDIQPDKYDFNAAFGWNDENVQEFLSKYIEKCLKEVTVKEDAKKYIKKLKEEGNRIVIITSRNSEECGPNVYKISEEWLKKNEIEADRIEQNCIQKVDKCRENKIDVFIDDNVDHCRDVSRELGINVILFNSIYNQNETNFKRAYNWEEVYNEIKQIENKK